MLTFAVRFFVNGNEIKLDNPDPELTLAYFIRNTLRLTGTKLSCEEGACGACTVVLGKLDANLQKIVYTAVNSCLVPVYMVDDCSVITVEGISKERIHPIQDRLSRCHGTQCGFCSPGFTMAMYALLRNTPSPTTHQIDQALKGNLCRCTGYRPILESMYSFAANGGCCGGNQNGVCPCKEGNNNLALETKLTTFEGFDPYEAGQEIIFPPKLLTEKDKMPISLKLVGERLTIFCPATLEEAHSIAHSLQDFKIVSSGMMARLILGLTPNNIKQTWISIHKITNLSEVELRSNSIRIGSALSIGQFTDYVRQHVPNSAGMLEFFDKYSAEQIKYTASWAGALASASGTSEFCSLALAANFTVHILNLENNETRSESVQKLFDTAGKTTLGKYDLLLSVEVPAESNAHYYTFKQGERRGADATVLNAVLKINTDSNDVRLVIGFGRKPQLIEKSSDQFSQQSLMNLSEKLDTWIPENFTKFQKSLIKSFLQNVASNKMHNDSNKFEFLQLFQKSNNNEANALGRPLAHQFAGRHTTGEAKYINDLKFDDLLHAAPVLSKEAHANILSVDASEALSLLGVIDYIDEKDIPPNGTNKPGRNHLGLIDDDTRVFAAGYAESIGQIIGVIIAEDVLIARRAAKLVKIEYEKLKPILTVDEALNQKSLLGDPISVGQEEDDVEKALSSCDIVVSGEVSIGGQEHLYMETQSSIVVPGEETEFVIYTSSQCIANAQTTAAQLIGVPSSDINIKVRRLGGAFGGKTMQCGFARNSALVAANKLKRPISMILHRNDDMLITGKRHPCKTVYKAGFSKNGILQALRLHVYVDGGWSIDNTVWVSSAIAALGKACYKISKYRSTAYPLKTNKSSNTAFRGYGVPQAFFTMDAIMNHAAQVLGLKFETIKELNFAKVGDGTLTGSKIQNDGMLECWEECKLLAKFDELENEVAEFNEGSEFIKRGVAMGATRFGMPHGGPFEAASALVQICIDGAVTVSIGGIEMGQGLNVKIQQCASTALGVPIARVKILDAATDKTINAPVTGGSQGADIHGKAVKVCCEKLLEGIKPFLEKTNGDWDKAVYLAYLNKTQLQISEFITIEREKFGLGVHDACYFTSGAACSLVELNTLTGEHKLLSIDIVMDVGKSLNPAIDIGQIEGGFIQGYGLMTSEDLAYDETGKLITDSAYKYKIPTLQMIPEKFRVKLLDGISNYPEQVYGSKGIGEPPLMLATSVHSALTKAILAKLKPVTPTVFNAPLTVSNIFSALSK